MFWYLCLLLVALIVGVESGSEESVLYTSGHQQYYISQKKVTYDEALIACQCRHMNLVSIQNKQKNDVIHKLLKQTIFSSFAEWMDGVWTSGSRRADKKTWLWLTGEKITYFNWSPYDPNNYNNNEECLEIWNESKGTVWGDVACAQKLHYICESSAPYNC